MKRSTAIFLTAVFCVSLAPFRGLCTQATSSRHLGARFTLSLSAKPTTVSPGAELRFILRLQSHAGSTWLVDPDLQQGPGASFELSIRDNLTGKEVSPPFFADARVPNGPVRLASLHPNGFFEAEVADQPRNFGMLPGHTYSVLAVYHSPLHKAFQNHLPVLSSADGTFTSQPVRVKVTS